MSQPFRAGLTFGSGPTGLFLYLRFVFAFSLCRLKTGEKKRTSGAKALVIGSFYGTTEVVP